MSSNEYDPVDGCLRFIGGGSFLYLRHGHPVIRQSDGAILYGQRYDGTNAPPQGYRLYAWYIVRSEFDFDRVSDEQPFSEYFPSRPTYTSGIDGKTYTIRCGYGCVDYCAKLCPAWKRRQR
jgi:hypothetical protein